MLPTGYNWEEDFLRLIIKYPKVPRPFVDVKNKRAVFAVDILAEPLVKVVGLKGDTYLVKAKHLKEPTNKQYYYYFKPELETGLWKQSTTDGSIKKWTHGD